MELATTNSEITISSIEIVDLINQERKAEAERNPGQKWLELRHDNFMAKVPKVLGENTAPKFLGTAKYAKGNNSFGERPIYNLPQREAFLMVMSESYELQAKLYDKYQELQKSGRLLTDRQILEMFMDLKKEFINLSSNVIALTNNLAIKNEPKIETKPYFQPSGNNSNNIDLHLYHRIVNYAKKFRTDLDLDIVRDRAKEIGMMASRLSKEKRIQIIKEDNLDGRYQNKISYYHENILKEVFDLIF